MSRFHCALPLASLWSGEMIGLVVDQRPVLLVNLDGKICAYEDRCRHQGVALSEGRLDGHVLTCRAHEWQYDALTGAGLNPGNVRLKSLPIRIEDHSIWVDPEAP